MTKPKAKKRSWILYGAVWLAFFGFIVIYSLSGNEDGSMKELTTNLDIKNKTINEELSKEEDVSGIIPEKLQMAIDEAKNLVVIIPLIANPAVTHIYVRPGMRKEEIAEILEGKLALNNEEKEKFFQTNIPSEGMYGEGFFYPGVYLLKKDPDGEFLGKLMSNRFNKDVIQRYATSTKKVINIDTAVKIASIIEREAGGKNDMRLVSGVIWNRIFKGMSLDMDATLQYAKGNAEIGWWPKVLSEDKFIDSPYNTYQEIGLPPTAISNPSLASIEAALNPKKTEYLFYIHDKNGVFHGAKNYKEHQKNIKKYYGK